MEERGAMRSTRGIASWIGVAAIAFMLFGMSGSVATAQDASPEAATDFPVHITFVNALTSLGSVDVYINGDEEEQRVVEGLEYGTISEQFDGTAPGTGIVVKQNVNVGFDRYLFSTLVPTEAGKSYVITISDLILIPVEFNTSSVADGSARTIGVHAAAQAPAFDVYVNVAGETGDATAYRPGLWRVTDGNTPPAGTYDITLTQTGTDTVALEQPASKLLRAPRMYWSSSASREAPNSL